MTKKDSELVLSLKDLELKNTFERVRTKQTNEENFYIPEKWNYQQLKG